MSVLVTQVVLSVIFLMVFVCFVFKQQHADNMVVVSKQDLQYLTPLFLPCEDKNLLCIKRIPSHFLLPPSQYFSFALWG